MSIKVAEIFSSIQGEGELSGELTTFIRLSGCNLSCPFCDTSHERGEDMSIPEIIRRAETERTKTVTLTGGEPLMHPGSSDLILALLRLDFRVRVETNGTFELRYPLEKVGRDDLFITLSPKGVEGKVAVQKVDCIKLLYPFLPGCTPEDYQYIGDDRTTLYIQPIQTPGMDYRQTCVDAIQVLRDYPDWKLGVQLHKLLSVR